MLTPEDQAVMSLSTHWIPDNLITPPRASKSKRALDDFYPDILSSHNAISYNNNLLSSHADTNAAFISHNSWQQQQQQWAPVVSQELNVPISAMSSMSLHDRVYPSKQQPSLLNASASASIREPSNFTLTDMDDLYELERTRDALELATALDDLDNTHSPFYQSPPPDGYLCKLCMVKGHWLRNCELYKERKKANIRAFGPFAIRPQLASRLVPTQPVTTVSNVRTTLPPDGYVCRKCHVPGHWIQQCPVPKQAPPPETYICKICMIKGHWIYQCPQRIPKQHFYNANIN